MRTWIRARVLEFCGACACRIEKGEPMQAVHLFGVTRSLKRCESCADAPVPSDVENLPDVIEHPALKPFREANADRMSRLGEIYKDAPKDFPKLVVSQRAHWTERDEP